MVVKTLASEGKLQSSYLALQLASFLVVMSQYHPEPRSPHVSKRDNDINNNTISLLELWLWLQEESGSNSRKGRHPTHTQITGTSPTPSFQLLAWKYQGLPLLFACIYSHLSHYPCHSSYQEPLLECGRRMNTHMHLHPNDQIILLNLE